MLRAGQFAELFVLFLVIVSATYYYRRFRQSSVIPIRRMDGLNAIGEAIGRATEMGRPVHFTTGCGGMVADTFAALAILDHVARQCARYNATLVVTNSQPVVQPITENIVKNAYAMEGRLESFKSGNIRYLSDTMQAYVSGVWGIMERERVAANIMMGYFFAESLLLAECGNRIGAFQVAGTASTPQLPFFVAACDHTLLGEELFAAGAYLTREPVRVGAVMAQDCTKILAIAAMLMGALMSTVGLDALVKWCDM
ncbi:MAG: DUF6754 domain-containing protein [Bacillota bacterium]